MSPLNYKQPAGFQGLFGPANGVQLRRAPTRLGGGIVKDEGRGQRSEDSGQRPEDDLSAEDLRALFVTIARALSFDALRMKPREKQLALLLASESFGEGLVHGAVDLGAWRLRLAIWRSNELKDTLEDWAKWGWIFFDAVEKSFRLAPDRWPGWPDVQAIQAGEKRQFPLHLATEDDLHKTFAKISQMAAAKKSQRGLTKISQHGETPMPGGVSSHGGRAAGILAPHDHVMSCNSQKNLQIHDHETAKISQHEVGELSRRSTDELLADIRQLNPKISPEFLGHWKERIEREAPDLVNAVIREAQMQRREIKNMGGFLNGGYLKAIRARNK